MKKYDVFLGIILCTLSLRNFAMSLTLASPDFSNNSLLPMQYTCNGAGVSPVLVWQDPPANTQSYVVIVDDPDAPGGLWVHWVLFNIPRGIRQLDVATGTPTGAISGRNSWGVAGYGAPCPPSGTHRYFFKLYALDTPLALDETANEQDVVKAMQHHIIEQSELIGLYTKK